MRWAILEYLWVWYQRLLKCSFCMLLTEWCWETDGYGKPLAFNQNFLTWWIHLRKGTFLTSALILKECYPLNLTGGESCPFLDNMMTFEFGTWPFSFLLSFCNTMFIDFAGVQLLFVEHLSWRDLLPALKWEMRIKKTIQKRLVLLRPN